ncbi:MAG: hypothetical protein NWT08_14345 [Akkermansiaceae bacterium]|jgi:hypothetical protein|nr:hypothetical protein [Akkermansiaceae bacterium]MDP4646715.1 hypothetical protein [Akkermansiaceae bacterium]MDP4721076.1 hypothetical protein [Akkermansiaceae bacterium]MDP4779631.1 hypothetical protein [Akkermansiaceae bacterium]MDP4846289.1 hypothetical protein [Akkermansiaceae bacterium]
MNPYFEKLGRTVATRWQEQNFSLAAFPELALTALNESPPCENVDLDEMIAEFLSNDEQPFQSQSGFGQPELVAFNHHRFYIQILFWLEGTTEIHQHEFSGAFHVMRGSSIHSEYDFDEAQAVTPHLRIGDLRMKHIELLETGRTIPITSGRDCIHSLFHLDTPSVTVVIRTHHDPGTGPQYNYLPPHIAIDPLHADPLTLRRQQLLDVLETLDDPDYAKFVGEMVENLDFERGFNILRYAMPRLQNLDEWESVLTIFQNRHGELAEGIPDTLAECLRRETLTGMRFHISDPDHRFFLALLMNVPTRKDIFAFIANRVPDQSPTETVLGWAEELIEPGDFGISLLDATFPETLDVPMEEQSNLLIAALAQALKEDWESKESTTENSAIQTALVDSCLRPLFL